MFDIVDACVVAKLVHAYGPLCKATLSYGESCKIEPKWFPDEDSIHDR